MSARKALPPERALVPRSLYFTALSRAIEWQRGALAAHDPLYVSGPACCAPGRRCDAYQRAAADLARFEAAKVALYAGRRAAQRATPGTLPAPEARREDPAASPSVFRCAECGGTRLRAWAHVNIHGDLGPDGLIERPDYQDDAYWPIIEESVTCKIHGEGPVEKLIDGQYTSLATLAMVNGRYVAAPRAHSRSC